MSSAPAPRRKCDGAAVQTAAWCACTVGDRARRGRPPDSRSSARAHRRRRDGRAVGSGRSRLGDTGDSSASTDRRRGRSLGKRRAGPVRVPTHLLIKSTHWPDVVALARKEIHQGRELSSSPRDDVNCLRRRNSGLARILVDREIHNSDWKRDAGSSYNFMLEPCPFDFRTPGHTISDTRS